MRWTIPAAATVAALLAGCAGLSPPPAAPAPALPAAWQAPLPHGGDVGELARWWERFDDPLLARLVGAGQQASPTLADARSRIAQARATRVAAGAALGPTLDANASASRGRFDLQSPVGTSLSAGVQAAWEIDLLGGNRAGREAAQARLDGAQASWHDARVAVAAEVASSYLQLRACEAQVEQTRVDAASRAETARLTELSMRAGFQAPANSDLARASAAQGAATLKQQTAQCELLVKGLVALTAIDEPALRGELAAARAKLPKPAELSVAGVPAQWLAQRPDLFAAERELAAASADTVQAEAQRYPRVTLAGNVGKARFEAAGVSVDGTTWSLGPVAVTLPLFDGGTRRENAAAAKARYDAAATRYAAQLRQAVREVEEALVALDSTAARGEEARAAAEGFERSYKATEARYRGGLASLFELEDARRSAVAAQSSLIELQRERVAAWISLYRALGGGWSPAEAAQAGADTPSAPQG